MKTAVIVVLAFAVGALAAPYNNPSPYPATTYKQPYNSYQSNDYNSYKNNDYSSYDTSYNQPAYNDYGKSSYNDYSPSYPQPNYNDYSSTYKQPAYNDYSSSYKQPSYNDYSSSYKQPAYNDYSSSYKQPAYNDYSSSYKQPAYNDYSSSYKQPDYSATSYQSNSYGYNKPCAALSSIKPASYGKKIAYVADDDVTEAYCGDRLDGKDNAFYVRSGQKCVVINERTAGLEESLTFSCNHQTGYWDLLAGSDTKYQAISQYDIVCADYTTSVSGCVADPTTAGDNTADDLSWFYPYNHYNGYY